MTQPTSNREVAVDKGLVFNYDLSKAPIGQLVLVLTRGGIAHRGFVTGKPERDKDLRGWHPLPARDKEQEAKLGLRFY